MAFQRCQLVVVTGDDTGLPKCAETSIPAVEEPELAYTHRAVGVTMVQPAGGGEAGPALRFGYLRTVAQAAGETWAVGDILWAASDGAATNVRPAAPQPQVMLGHIFQDEGSNNFSVVVDMRVIPAIGELSGVARETPEDFDILIYDAATHAWYPRRMSAADIAVDGPNDATDLAEALAELSLIDRGYSFASPTSGARAAVFVAPYPVRVVEVRAVRSGGSAATVMARRNGISDHLSSNLSLSSDEVSAVNATVQNTDYAVGDWCEVEVVSQTGGPTFVFVEVVFLRITPTVLAEGGSYSVTGTAVGLRKDKRITAGSGSYTVTGSDVTLTKA